jgi:hypothetical protein
MDPEFRRDGNFRLYAFDPKQLGAVAHLIAPAPNSTRPMTGAEVMAAHPEALACVNGAQFSIGSDQPRGRTMKETYARSQRDVLDFRLYDPAAGIDAPGGKHGQDGSATLSVAPDRAHWYKGDASHPGSTFAAQAFPCLVYDGRARDTGDGDTVPVTAHGILRDGRVFFAYDVSRRPGFSRRLVSAGAVYAGYNDGGGSARLIVRGGENVGHRDNRRCACWLVCLAPGAARTPAKV